MEEDALLAIGRVLGRSESTSDLTALALCEALGHTGSVLDLAAASLVSRCELLSLLDARNNERPHLSSPETASESVSTAQMSGVKRQMGIIELTGEATPDPKRQGTRRLDTLEERSLNLKRHVSARTTHDSPSDW